MERRAPDITIPKLRNMFFTVLFLVVRQDLGTNDSPHVHTVALISLPWRLLRVTDAVVMLVFIYAVNGLVCDMCHVCLRHPVSCPSSYLVVGVLKNP